MSLSFKAIRNIGLASMTAIILAMGFVFFFTTTRITNSLFEITQNQRPRLELAEEVRNSFLDAREIFNGYLRMEHKDINPAVVSMNRIINKSEELKKFFPEEDVNRLITAAKRFRLAVATHADEAQTDITGSRAIEMEKIALTTAGDTEIASARLIKKARGNIKAHEVSILAISKNSWKISLIGILLGISAGLLVAFFMGRGLNRPIRQLVDGTQRIAKGDLTSRLKVESHDEIGQLSEAFNKMAEGLSVSIQKEKELTATAEVAAENEKKRGVELSEEITERKKMEKSLRESEGRYRSLFVSSRDAIMTIDPPDWKFTSGNPATIEMFKAKNEEEFLAYDPWKLSPELQPDGKASDEKAKKMIEVALCEGFKLFEWTHKRISGEVFPAEVLLSKVEEGGKVFLHAVVRDITERKNMELEREISLKRQEDITILQQSLLISAPFENKLNAITSGIVRIFDADFCRIWLIRPGDLCEQGCSHARVREGPHVCRFRDKCLHLVSSSGRYTLVDGKGHARIPFGCYKIGRIASGEEHKFVTNDAENDPRMHNHGWVRELGLVSFAGYQLRIPGGETIGVLGLFAKHPISAAEDAALDSLGITTAFIVQQAAAERVVADAMKIRSDFTSMVSHELRTPLTAIKESISIVLEEAAGKLNDEQKDFLGMSRRNVDRLSRLINDVLDYQKLESGKFEFNMQGKDMNEVIKEVQNTMASVAKNKGLDIILDLDENLPKTKFDRDKIVQVLTNLINNAIKFTEKGSITIASSKKDNFVHLAVKDTGPGIKKEDLPRLFVAFEQLEKGKDRKTGGTGLGLAISKEIIEKHKGKIWAESELGKGTTFQFILPLKAKDKVLVIDDDRGILDTIKKFLEKEGYDVAILEKGLDAIETMQKEEPDLVILDMKLKDTSGYEVIGRMKSNKHTLRIPIVAMSGYPVELTKVKDREEELALASLAKPFDMKDLLSVVHAQLK
ncbi:MAG: ATP-binding protein [Candidatus Omnitrophica bacterium]|nr:ATP-binding protein [Candidatus Omnitrophota bacterium]